MIWVGTCGFAGTPAETFGSLDAVEIPESFSGPSARERGKAWRAAAPPGFRFALVASRGIAPPADPTARRPSGSGAAWAGNEASSAFPASPLVSERWEATREAADALQAQAIVFVTPVSFGPTPDHIAALYGFFEPLRTGAIRVWEPQAPWPAHLIETACEDLRLVHAVDPFAAEPATGGLAYFRVRGSPPSRMPNPSAYSDADLLRLAAMCREYDDAFVFFGHAAMAADAARLRALAAAPEARDKR